MINDELIASVDRYTGRANRSSHHSPRYKATQRLFEVTFAPDQTIKMTKTVLYYRGSSIGITSQFLDCNRVGAEGAEQEEKQKKRRAAAAELHNRATADRRAVASVMD